MDCSCALRISPEHVKSLLRRATARAQLGKYRAAIDDLQTANALDPTKYVKKQSVQCITVWCRAIKYTSVVNAASTIRDHEQFCLHVCCLPTHTFTPTCFYPLLLILVYAPHSFFSISLFKYAIMPMLLPLHPTYHLYRQSLYRHSTTLSNHDNAAITLLLCH